LASRERRRNAVRLSARLGDSPDLPTVLAATKRLLEGQSPLARWRTTAFDDLEDVFLL